MSSPRPSDSADRWLTIPNALCAVRLVGSPALVALGWLHAPYPFLAWFLFLTFTDWLDGKLAIRLNQRSKVGPMLDSIADVAMYGSLAIGAVILKWDTFLAERVWLGIAVAMYALNCIYAVAKLRRLPTYHAYSAKVSWFITAVGMACMVTDFSVWPFRIAMCAVVVANVEGLLITSQLTTHRSDAKSIFHVLKRNANASES